MRELEACLGPKFECVTAPGHRVSSLRTRRRKLTSDSSQHKAFSFPHTALPAVKFSTRSIGGQGACFPRLPDFAGKASRETEGGRPGNGWKAPHSAGGGGGGAGSLPGGRGTKRGARLAETAVAARSAAGSGCPRRSPRPAPEPAARPPPPPLPLSRASCHGDQTCLCASLL